MTGRDFHRDLIVARDCLAELKAGSEERWSEVGALAKQALEGEASARFLWMMLIYAAASGPLPPSPPCCEACAAGSESAT